ncbi:hypothetical protein MKW94_013212 [Papaver nudicaule]|uniref:Glycosyltransferase n=1 Tax=Papaver nudicaule TaxID=74823 RepID=A0AA41VBE1_PAPNU|nr:hypothetical protein [Papaver nudicaule]
MEETAKNLQPHVIILPTPGMGHLIPLTELAKRLVSHHGFTVTFTVPSESYSPVKAQKLVLDSLPSSIDHMFLSPVDLTDLPADVKPETWISYTVTRSLPSLSDSFKLITSTHRVVAFVVDLFGCDAFDVAKEFNVKPYIFFPSNAMFLSLFLQLPKLDQDYTCEYIDVPEPIRIPGCVPINGIDLFDPAQDKKNEAYRWILHHAERYKLAEGIMVNSFNDLEPGPIEALKGGECGNPPVYPVGPLIRTGDVGGVSDPSGCLKWLDDQPVGSVLFVSFGSVGTLSSEQMTELALGLEMSEKRFLWVARSPYDKVATAAFLNSESIKDPLDFLPEGFLERTNKQGLVVPSWAPQVQVLSHASTGGFLTHCGWNSTLESVVHGVPLIAWPLFAEQKMNAVMLEDSKVALRPKPNEHGIIGREEISRIVKGLMAGEEGMHTRNRVKELKSAATRALEENGSSAKSLEKLTNLWKT